MTVLGAGIAEKRLRKLLASAISALWGFAQCLVLIDISLHERLERQRPSSSSGASLKNLRDYKPSELTSEELEDARADETPEEQRARVKRTYRHYTTGESLSGSDLERERAFYEDGKPRARYKSTKGLEKDPQGRPLSPATGRALSFGIDCLTPDQEADEEEKAWRLEIEYNRSQKTKQPKKRKKH